MKKVENIVDAEIKEVVTPTEPVISDIDKAKQVLIEEKQKRIEEFMGKFKQLVTEYRVDIFVSNTLEGDKIVSSLNFKALD